MNLIQFDVKMSKWPEFRRQKKHFSLFGRKEALFWERIWDSVYNDEIDTWDHQWFFSRLLHGTAIQPGSNLVSNIGFSEAATHTKNSSSLLANLPSGEIQFPLQHPDDIAEDKFRDDLWSHQVTSSSSFVRRLILSRSRMKN